MKESLKQTKFEWQDPENLPLKFLSGYKADPAFADADYLDIDLRNRYVKHSLLLALLSAVLSSIEAVFIGMNAVNVISCLIFSFALFILPHVAEWIIIKIAIVEEAIKKLLL